MSDEDQSGQRVYLDPSAPDQPRTWAGDLNVGILGLCGPQAREEMLAQLPDRQG